MNTTPERFREMIMDAAELCVAPIWASAGVGELPLTVDHNGTATFIDTGSRKLLVTANHVLAKLESIRAANPNAGLAINLGSGVTPFLERMEIIDRDPEMDVAVLCFGSLASWSGHKKRYFPVRTSPIPMPRRGDAVTIVGYPGLERHGFDNFGVFSPAGVGMVVSNDPRQNVILANESGTLRTVTNGEDRSGGFEPGGMSGSAGFFFRNGAFHIAGFVYEGRADVFFLTPGARLKSDGSLASA